MTKEIEVWYGWDIRDAIICEERKRGSRLDLNDYSLYFQDFIDECDSDEYWDECD